MLESEGVFTIGTRPKMVTTVLYVKPCRILEQRDGLAVRRVRVGKFSV